MRLGSRKFRRMLSLTGLQSLSGGFRVQGPYGDFVRIGFSEGEMRRIAAFYSTNLLSVCTFSVAVLAQVLSPEREHALKTNDSFKECDTCPEMVVVPAGSFT